MQSRPWWLAIVLSFASFPTAACDGDDPAPDEELRCVDDALPLQNPRAHTLGETFYLPVLRDDPGCASDAAWELLSAPADSRNEIYSHGAPAPRFTPDVAGSYEFRSPGIEGATLTLEVVERSASERFRNHFLTPLYGAARVGDEIWTANGATYSVSRVGRDPATGRWTRLDEIATASWPAAIAWRAPLPFALVAHRGSDTVGFVDRERGALEDALWVGDEPTAIAISPAADRAYVSLPTMRQVVVIDLANRTVAARIDVGMDPRGLALSAAGDALYALSYRSANRAADAMGVYEDGAEQDLRVIDTGSLEVVDTITPISSLQRALALSADGELFIVATNGNPMPTQAADGGKAFAHELLVLDTGTGAVVRRADLSTQASSLGPVVGPSGVVVAGETAWVAAEAAGLVVALDRTSLVELDRFEVGPGARQLLALDDGSIAVHCHESLELWILDPDDGVTEVVSLAEDARPPAVALGERVYNRPGAGFAANHSCASCHVEAQNEGMRWRFGPDVWANVRPLQLLTATAPLGWSAYVARADNFSYQGPASIVSRPATQEEAAGLGAFLGSLLGAPRATGYTRLDGSYTEAGLRGKALFDGAAGCADCHAPPLYTNRRTIDVGKSGEPADVPTLLGAYRHGVYFVHGQARDLRSAVDVALEYVGVDLAQTDRDDLLAFLRELTPKGGAPLGIWPDIDSAEAVYPDVRPWMEFADPIDPTADGRSVAEVAAAYVSLEDAEGRRVPAEVAVDGGRIELVPEQPLAAGASYRLIAREGLPFLSGGALWADRETRFQVAAEPRTLAAGSVRMTVELPSRGGGAQVLDFALRAAEGSAFTGAASFVAEPLQFGTQQRQLVWLRIDGDQARLSPFALPVNATAVADASGVTGAIAGVDDAGGVTAIEGTLSMTAPGTVFSDIPFRIDVE